MEDMLTRQRREMAEACREARVIEALSAATDAAALLVTFAKEIRFYLQGILICTIFLAGFAVPLLIAAAFELSK